MEEVMLELAGSGGFRLKLTRKVEVLLDRPMRLWLDIWILSEYLRVTWKSTHTSEKARVEVNTARWNIKGRKHCTIWQHRGLKGAINKTEMPKTTPQPPWQTRHHKKSILHSGEFQLRQEGGRERGGERESDLLATAKAEGTRVKDGNGWFWDAKSLRPAQATEPDGVSDLEDTSNHELVHFLSRDC